MARISAGRLVALTFAASLQAYAGKELYFTSTGAMTTSIKKLDLGTGKQLANTATTVIEYPNGPYNAGGGATAICRLGKTLYWGDQLTVSVHSADIADGKLMKHNPSFIANLTDPQGVACDAAKQTVYVVDATGIFLRTTTAGSPTQHLDMSGTGVRSVKIVDGKLWFGTDTGIFRSTATRPGSIKVGGSDGKIYEDFEVLEARGRSPLIFATTYDWSGLGVIRSELDQPHENMTSAWQQMHGGGCQRGSELAWGIAGDASTKTLYWVVVDDALRTSMKIMYKSYESDGVPQVAYNAVGSGYGIVLVEDSQTIVV